MKRTIFLITLGLIYFTLFYMVISCVALIIASDMPFFVSGLTVVIALLICAGLTLTFIRVAFPPKNTNNQSK